MILPRVPLGVVAWVLVRYAFPAKRFIDALVDLPFTVLFFGLIFGLVGTLGFVPVALACLLAGFGSVALLSALLRKPLRALDAAKAFAVDLQRIDALPVDLQVDRQLQAGWRGERLAIGRRAVELGAGRLHPAQPQQRLCTGPWPQHQPAVPGRWRP